MSQNNLELLFKLTQQAAQKLKQQDPDADGKAFWQPLKKLFETYALSASQWQQLDPELVKKLSLLPETDSLGRTIEINHFLRQQVRIPLEEPWKLSTQANFRKSGLKLIFRKCSIAKTQRKNADFLLHIPVEKMVADFLDSIS